MTGFQEHTHKEAQWLEFVRDPLSVYEHMMASHHNDPFPAGRMEMWKVGMGAPMPTGEELAKIHIHSHDRLCPSDPPEEGGPCRYDLRNAINLKEGQ